MVNKKIVVWTDEGLTPASGEDLKPAFRYAVPKEVEPAETVEVPFPNFDDESETSNRSIDKFDYDSWQARQNKVTKRRRFAPVSEESSLEEDHRRIAFAQCIGRKSRTKRLNSARAILDQFNEDPQAFRSSSAASVRSRSNVSTSSSTPRYRQRNSAPHRYSQSTWRDPSHAPSLRQVNYADDGFDFDTAEEQFEDVAKAQQQKKRKHLQEKSLLARAMDMLSRREHSRKEMALKLRRYLKEDETEKDLKQVLDKLEELKFLSDERFAQTRVRGKSRSLGDRRLRYDLKMKGVDSSTIDKALDAIEEPETHRCFRVWQKKFDERPTDRKEKDRQIRYLAYRGFSFDCIYKIINGEFTEEDYEEESQNSSSSIWD